AEKRALAGENVGKHQSRADAAGFHGTGFREHRTRSGPVLGVEVRSTPLRLGGGEAVLVDVRTAPAPCFPAKSLAAEPLSTDAWRRLVDSNVIGILRGDHGGRIIDANHAFLEMVGYTRADPEGGRLRWDWMTPPEYREIDHQSLVESSTLGASRAYEKEFIRKD